MTNRERLLTIMDGGMPDRVPWIPRLLLWYNAHRAQGTLPERFGDASLEEVEAALGMGNPARSGRVFTQSQGGDVEVEAREEGASTITTYRTPAGSVSRRHQISEALRYAGIGALEVEHMIKGPDDFPVVEYLVTHTEYAASYEAYSTYEAEVGEDGYPLVATGDCPLHHFLQHYAGYQAGFYLLYDYPDKVEHLMQTMEGVERERVWPLVAGSPARMILNGLHLDSSITPPPLFEKYITPYYKDFSSLLHDRGKILCMHADNDSRLILKQIQDAGYDMVETFTTAPQVSCTLADAREAWGSDVIIWGAVPSVILEDTYSGEAFEAYMRDLFRTAAPGKAFILGVADNIMPHARLDRLERIAEMVDAWGACPIDPGVVA